jgi:hypothetical protein
MQKQIYTKEEMQKHIDTLPTEIKNLLYSTEEEIIVQKVGLDNRLHLDQVSMLMAVTNDVMAGFLDTKEYPKALMESLDVDEVKANTIAKAVDDMLFDKIRDAMKKAYAEATATPTIPSSNPPAMDMAPAIPGKSVVMPSAMVASAATPTPVTPAVPLSTDMQIDAPAGSVPAQTAAPVPQMPEADVMLREPTVSLPSVATPSVPATTKIEPAPTYKADPYREPIE